MIRDDHLFTTLLCRLSSTDWIVYVLSLFLYTPTFPSRPPPLPLNLLESSCPLVDVRFCPSFRSFGYLRLGINSNFLSEISFFLLFTSLMDSALVKALGNSFFSDSFFC